MALNRARGLKYAGPLEGVSASLTRPQYEEGIGMGRNVVVCDLKRVTNFYFQIARKWILNSTASSYCSRRTFCDGVRIHVM